MFRRIASLCCILPLLGVASGLALDWHRSTPATADRPGAVPICCSHSHDEAPPEAPASGDHENCPVCHVLASAAQPVLPPPVAVVSRLTYPVEVAAVLDQVACSVVPALPSQPRAPPAV